MTEPTHILIIDDDSGSRQFFQTVLTSEGYRVSLASDGEEALSYLQLITPDLVLLDLMLPDMDGREVASQIKADHSKPFVPVMMITGRTDLEASVMSLDAGADDFLVKPVEIDELLARVRAMLRLQRTQRSLHNEQQKTELLLHLTRELGASIQLDVLLTRFLDHLADAVGAIRASMILREYEGEQAICYSSTRNPSTTFLRDILQSGVAGWVLRENRPLVIVDTREDPRWVGNASFHYSVRSVAAMPVIREGRTLAVITLVHHTPGYFSDQHVELLSSVAAQSAVALESAQLFSLTQHQKELLARRADELRRLNEVGAMLSELMQPDELLRRVVYMVQQQFAYPQVSVLWREDDELVVHATLGTIHPEPLQPIRFPIDKGLNGWAVHHHQNVRVDDAQADARFLALLPTDGGVRSELVFPILLRGGVLGTLDVQSPLPAAFGTNDETLLSTIVGQLSTALGNALLLEEEQRRVQQLNQVNDLSVAITAQLDVTQNLQLAADAVAKVFGVRQAGIVLWTEDAAPGEVIVALHGASTAADQDLRRVLAQADDLFTHIQRLRAPQVITYVQDDPRMQLLQRFLRARGITSLMIVPLKRGARVQGLLGIDATARTDGFGSADQGLATTVASLIVQVIDNARLYRTVEDERSTLNAVLRGAADPILLVGPGDELLLANRAAEERLHLNLEESRGRPLHELVNGYANPVLHQLLPLMTVDSQVETTSGPVELSVPQNTTYSVSIASVRGADGQPLGRVAVLQDITAIKELEQQERERVRSVFRRYVSPPVAERLLSAGQELGQPTECEVAVLFADMRGFTSLSERIGPGVLIERILNRYFTAMTEVLYRHDGTIDKFLGDGIIGVFGTPIARPDDPQRATRAAVDMQRAFAHLSRVWREELGFEIGMGIGISYGRAVVGNIGSEQRLDYTLIGDVVNTASRLSGVARAGQIIVSYHLHDVLPADWDPHLSLHPLGHVSLKGKQEPHLIYEVRYQ